MTADDPSLEGAAFASEEMDVDASLVRMGELLDHLQGITDEDTKGKIFELLDWIDGLHREAAVRIASMLPMDALASLREDPVIDRLFQIYSDDEDVEDPDDLAGTLEEALDEIRPYLHSHGGEMEILDVAHGVVRMRLMGSCHGCPSSSVTLTQGVEQILKERWPSFRRIEVEGPEETAAAPKVLQIESLRRG